MKCKTKEEMLERLNALMERDWFHYMADRLTKNEIEEWKAEKVEFNNLREQYKTHYGELPTEIENWGFHTW